MAIGMMVGLMKPQSSPPKPVIDPPTVQRQVVTAERPAHRQKKNDWQLAY